MCGNGHTSLQGATAVLRRLLRVAELPDLTVRMRCKLLRCLYSVIGCKAAVGGWSSYG